jgi:hypothetical protein
MAEEWPDHYAREKEYRPVQLQSSKLRRIFADGMDSDIGNALELLGDPTKVQHPVHTPQVAGWDGPDLEQKTYLWFVANEKTQQEMLKPLIADTQELPPLHRHRKTRR